jgi:hypothetical protein
MATPTPVRKGRSNAILTYDTVEAIKLGVQQALLGIQHLDDTLTKAGTDAHEKFMDHEARLRVLEKSNESKSGGLDLGKWLYGNLWSTIMGFIAVGSLLYTILSHKP